MTSPTDSEVADYAAALDADLRAFVLRRLGLTDGQLETLIDPFTPDFRERSRPLNYRSECELCHRFTLPYPSLP